MTAPVPIFPAVPMPSSGEGKASQTTNAGSPHAGSSSEQSFGDLLAGVQGTPEASPQGPAGDAKPEGSLPPLFVTPLLVQTPEDTEWARALALLGLLPPPAGEEGPAPDLAEEKQDAGEGAEQEVSADEVESGAGSAQPLALPPELAAPAELPEGAAAFVARPVSGEALPDTAPCPEPATIGVVGVSPQASPGGATPQTVSPAPSASPEPVSLPLARDLLASAGEKAPRKPEQQVQGGLVDRAADGAVPETGLADPDFSPDYREGLSRRQGVETPQPPVPQQGMTEEAALPGLPAEAAGADLTASAPAAPSEDVPKGETAQPGLPLVPSASEETRRSERRDPASSQRILSETVAPSLRSLLRDGGSDRFLGGDGLGEKKADSGASGSSPAGGVLTGFRQFLEGAEGASDLEPLVLSYQGDEAFREALSHVLRVVSRKDGVRAHLVVDPPALGRVDVSLQVTAAGIEATLKVDNEALKQMVQTQMEQLKASLQAQGLHVTGLAVDLRSRDDSRPGQQQGPGGKVRRASGPAGEGTEEEGDVLEARVDLRRGLLHWVA